MTTTAIPPVAAALDLPVTFETHGFEFRGPFDFEWWCGRIAVHHTASNTLLTFCTTPAECREYVDSGRAREAYEQKRTEGER